MKCKYTFPVTARITLPMPFSFQRGSRTFSLELENGRLARLGVLVDNFPDVGLPQLNKGSPLAIHFPRDPELEVLLPDMRALEGALSIWGVQRIDTVQFKTEWIAENDDDRAKLSLFSFERSREEAHPCPGTAIDLMLRTIVSVEKFRGLEIPLNFYRRGRQAVNQERYIEAFYEFYFFVESLYGNGKYKTHAVAQEFIGSADLAEAIGEAVTDFDLKLKSDPMLTTAFQEKYATKPKAEIIRQLVELRGFLHHHSIKNKQAWNPGVQLGYKVDAHFWQSVCHAAATKYATNLLFDPVEMQKFAVTVVRNLNGGVVRFTPAPVEPR